MCCEGMGIHHSTVKNIWSRFVSCKSLEPAPRSGRPMKLQYADLEYIKCLKTERPSLTHAEVRDKLEENANISIDISTVCKAVKRKLDPVEWTRKRLVTLAGERFTDRNMAYIGPTQVFIDVLNNVNPGRLKFFSMRVAFSCPDVANLYMVTQERGTLLLKSIAARRRLTLR